MLENPPFPEGFSKEARQEVRPPKSGYSECRITGSPGRIVHLNQDIPNDGSPSGSASRFNIHY
jgi:hypothetical protein